MPPKYFTMHKMKFTLVTIVVTFEKKHGMQSGHRQGEGLGESLSSQRDLIDFFVHLTYNEVKAFPSEENFSTNIC